MAIGGLGVHFPTKRRAYFLTADPRDDLIAFGEQGWRIAIPGVERDKAPEDLGNLAMDVLEPGEILENIGCLTLDADANSEFWFNRVACCVPEIVWIRAASAPGGRIAAERARTSLTAWADMLEKRGYGILANRWEPRAGGAPQPVASEVHTDEMSESLDRHCDLIAAWRDDVFLTLSVVASALLNAVKTENVLRDNIRALEELADQQASALLALQNERDGDGRGV